ncbi:hypothetical protein [Enterococcus faecalis]|uniref:hypothetical protein n=1 Tax=Enterococcus faecalis TaxID=1351 RepID=UPI0040413895
MSSIGYTHLTLDLKVDSSTLLQTYSNPMIENEHYQITININGAVDILDKSINTLYNNQAIIEENGDYESSFNY